MMNQKFCLSYGIYMSPGLLQMILYSSTYPGFLVGGSHLATAEVEDSGVTLKFCGGPGKVYWPSWKHVPISFMYAEQSPDAAPPAGSLPLQ